MRRTLAAWSLLFLLACGGSKPQTQAGPPLTAEQQKVFDDGVDFVAMLEGLEGRWLDDWTQDLSHRVQHADLIALVTVRTLRTDTDPQQRVTYRLNAEVTKTLVGEPKGKEIELAVDEDDTGFPTVHDNLGRIVDQSFVAYVKRGPDKLRWHLSPASEAIVVQTQAQITAFARAPDKAPGDRVIVHTN